ncbi:MAG TPA: hypothetical protein VF614_02855 [Chthoniobacteraceae bacterium]
MTAPAAKPPPPTAFARTGCAALVVAALGVVSRFYASLMNERLVTLILPALLLLSGCSTGGRLPNASQSLARTDARADANARLEEHYDRLEAQAARVERWRRRVLPSSPKRIEGFAAMRRMERNQRRFFAAHNIVLGSDYYQARHRLLRGFSEQLHHLEQSLTRLRNARNG